MKSPIVPIFYLVKRDSISNNFSIISIEEREFIRYNKVNFANFKSLMRATSYGLTLLHFERIAHCDVKPENILKPIICMNIFLNLIIHFHSVIKIL
jgi:serine/threonine protein kinase